MFIQVNAETILFYVPFTVTIVCSNLINQKTSDCTNIHYTIYKYTNTHIPYRRYIILKTKCICVICQKSPSTQLCCVRLFFFLKKQPPIYWSKLQFRQKRQHTTKIKINQIKSNQIKRELKCSIHQTHQIFFDHFRYQLLFFIKILFEQANMKWHEFTE